MSEAGYNVGGVLLPRPFQLRRLGHFGFFNEDNAACARFYAENLGLRTSDSHGLSKEEPPLVYFTTYGSDHHAVVHVDSKLAAKDNPFYRQGITFNQISFQVQSLAEIANAYQYCVEHELKIFGVGRDFPGSNWALYFYGPEGLLFELFYGMEQIGWQRESKPEPLYLNGPIFLDPHNVPKMPFRSEFEEILGVEATASLPKGFREVLHQPFQYEVGGVSLARPFAVNKIGPVHVFLEDVPTCEKFCVEHLGMKLTEEVVWKGHRCVYLRSGAEHHTLALFPIALRDELKMNPATKLMSLGVEVGSYQQLKDARAFLRGKGITIFEDIPAELRPGIDYAFYVRDPSGHALMFYYYMEQLGWQGQPRPAAARRHIDGEWPEVLTALSDTYMDQTLQGPLA